MSIQPRSRDRFRDPLVRVHRFADEVLVRCPGCGDCAVVLAHLGAPEYQGFRGDGTLKVRRRLRCSGCGLFKDEFLSSSVIGAPVDPYFRLPLWLQAQCCGHLLWAYNSQHVDLLESYVAAKLRERGTIPGSMSMLERLPAWLKSDLDLKSYRRWYDYSRARDAMFAATDTDLAPWYLAHSDDKRRARLNIISHLLSQVPYKPLPSHEVTLPKRQRPSGYVEPDLELRYIPTPF